MSTVLNQTSRRVLVVEDNPDNQQLATWILEDHGFKATCVDSAEEGLELLEISRFDIVLMDISLPGMDGKEATRKIRQSPHLAKLPVLALTAHAVHGEREDILASGVNGLATKPVDETELIALINSLLAD
jgi:Response regulators consisting of a CheY-like receiver domain and a winged-helix DNA-binding domain